MVGVHVQTSTLLFPIQSRTNINIFCFGLLLRESMPPPSTPHSTRMSLLREFSRSIAILDERIFFVLFYFHFVFCLYWSHWQKKMTPSYQERDNEKKNNNNGDETSYHVMTTIVMVMIMRTIAATTKMTATKTTTTRMRLTVITTLIIWMMIFV